MLLLCLRVLLLVPPQAPAVRAADEVAIREIVERYVGAREKGEAGAIAALFTSDADQLTSSGEWRKGKGAVVRGMLASSQRTRGRRAITIESIRFPAMGVALADGRYEIAGLAGLEGGPTRRMWTTLLMTRSTDGWRIAAIRNMLPASPPPAGGP